MSQEINPIYLRIMAFEDKGKFFAICIDTNIVVRGETMQNAKDKMIDAISSYLNTFSVEEINSGQYVRIAPFKYRFLYKALPKVIRFLKLITQTSKIEYNPDSKNVRFA